MRNPNDVLVSLTKNAKREGYRFSRLYRNLYNPDFYALAYQNIYANMGNMTAGTNEETIDGMSVKRVNTLIESLKDHSYTPNPAKRVNIPKKNGKTRPLGIPSFSDKLVQEIVRMLLEAIFELNMSECSHGFRPQRSCHTALAKVSKEFKGATWFIEGDIESFFDNINHHKLIELLRNKIDDEYFISLIWKFLKAGYVDNGVRITTYSGTPQGSLISPILSNIYLNELDNYMDEYMKSFNKGDKRKSSKAYTSAKDKARWIEKQKYTNEEWQNLSVEERKYSIKTVRAFKKQSKNMNSTNMMDPNFRRLKYVRYADDFICSVIGSKDEALQIKEDIKSFLENQLALKLSPDKTLITHGHKKARFLGYDIFVSDSNDQITTASGIKGRFFKGRIKLEIPKDKWVGKLLELEALKIKQVDGKEIFEPIHRNFMISNDDLEILNQFNSEIRGFKNYYTMADNISVLNNFYYIMSYSMFKTYAAKYKTRISVIRKKYGYQKFGVNYVNKSGKKCKAYFYDEGFKRNNIIIKTQEVDILPNNLRNLNSTSLMDKLAKRTCEYCKKENVDTEMHHVKKLKDLKGKANWEKLMIARNRKTIALCTECHDKLHAGKLS